MDNKAKKLLMQALNKYYRIKADVAFIEKNVAIAQATLKGADDLYMRKCLVGQGEILEEDLIAHTYIATVNVGRIGANEALVVTAREGNTMTIAAYAKEGLIRQNLARKAIDKILTRVK